MSQQQWGHGYHTGLAEGAKQGETPPPAPPPFRLQTEYPGLDHAWNSDDCRGRCEGPYVLLEHTNQRKCLLCFYMEAFTNGMIEGDRQRRTYMQALEEGE